MSAKYVRDSGVRQRGDEFKPSQETMTIEYAQKVRPIQSPFQSIPLSKSINTFIPDKKRISVAVS